MQYTATPEIFLLIMFESESVSCSVMSDSCSPWTVARQAPLSIGILQARILEWVAMPSSRESSQPRDFLHCRWILYHLNHQGSLSHQGRLSTRVIRDLLQHRIYSTYKENDFGGKLKVTLPVEIRKVSTVWWTFFI